MNCFNPNAEYEDSCLQMEAQFTILSENWIETAMANGWQTEQLLYIMNMSALRTMQKTRKAMACHLVSKQPGIRPDYSY